MNLYALSATEAARGIREGLFSCVELLQSCLLRIEQTDAAIGAWVFLDPDLALAQARAADDRRAKGRAMGPLHGVPVGIKDIYDTADMPTCYGSPIYAERAPGVDCTVVSKLKEAGAVIMGKTVTTEFAFLAPSTTQNPHRPGHTPGGSSSGSAAAVAAQQIPLAIGSQTNGSVIRPASFCGVYGFKPTRGLISRSGVLRTSSTLDQVGVFARFIKDIALITDQLTGYDINDSATAAVPKPHLSSGYRQEASGEPRFAFVSAPYDDRLAQDTRAGFAQLQKTLKAYAEPIDLPDGYGNMIDHHRVIHDIEIHQLLSADLVAHPQLMSPQITGALQRAAEHSQEDYAQAIDAIDAVDTFFCELFNEFDAIIAPSAAGEAPATLKQTGDPIFCTLWTLAGLPALTMPLLKGSTHLPIGVQLIAGAEQDARLMRTARWLCNLLEK